MLQRKNIWKAVQRLGLVVLFRQNEAARRLIKILPMLAFLPPADVLQVYDDIYRSGRIELGLLQDLRPLLDYFEVTDVKICLLV